MSLISDIQQICTDLYPNSSFILSSKFNANVASFFETAPNFPIIILDNELSKNASIQKNNNVLKDSKILITVLQLDSVDNTDTQSDAIRQACEDIAHRIAVRIYQLIPVRLVSGNQKYKLTPMFHVFAQNLTGVALEMQANYNTIVQF
jgi:hypothetical protein